MDDPNRGIQFGAEGLSIPLIEGSAKVKIATSRLGTFYAKDSKLAEKGRSLFASSESLRGAELVSLKVKGIASQKAFLPAQQFLEPS